MLNFCGNKRGLILKSALTVFLNYGFKKTSMDDIAREAKMSRPALYQVFKNKSDIFRAISLQMMENAAISAENAFRENTSLRDQLFACIDNSILQLHRFVDQTPHGVELTGINQEIAHDIEVEWKVRMVTIITNGIENAVKSGDADLERFSEPHISPQSIAQIIMHSMEGMRNTYLCGQPIDHYVETLIDFVAQAISSDTQARKQN
jgi:AcrR family transcriptional regulator